MYTTLCSKKVTPKLLRNCAVDFVEICNVYVGKMIIKAAKRIFNSDKICCSYSDLNFGVTFLEHSVYWCVAGRCVVLVSDAAERRSCRLCHRNIATSQ